MVREAIGRVRASAACASVAVAFGALAYAAIGDRSVDHTIAGDRLVGPVHASPALLALCLMLAVAVGLVAGIELAVWTYTRRIARGWWIVVACLSAGAIVTAWSWRELTAARNTVVGDEQPWYAIGAVLVAWALVAVAVRSRVSSVRTVATRSRGCAYCSAADSLRFGDVQIVSTDERAQTILLRCPRCGWLYAAEARRPELAQPISEAEARDTFPSTW